MSHNKHFICLLPIVLFVFAAGASSGQTKSPTPSANVANARTASGDVLATLRAKHPRLFLDERDIARLKRDVERDAYLRRWHTALRGEAEKMLATPPIEFKMEGTRLLKQSRTALHRISTLAGLYRLSGDRRYAEAARRDMLSIAGFESWSPIHFLDNAELTNAMGIGYDWLYDFLSPQDRLTVRRAIVEKGLRVGLKAYEEKVWWTTNGDNWNQVCNGGMTVGALAIADEEPELAGRIINHARASIVHSMNSFAPDGGWEEGPVYWVYGTAYAVYYLAALESALGTDFDFKRTPGLSDTGLYYIQVTSPSMLLFNYADGKPAYQDAPQLFWLARTFDKPEYIRQARTTVASPNFFHLLWYRPVGGKADAASSFALDSIFKGSNVATFRGAWANTNAVYVGFKGGDNSAGHAHLDLGTFVMDADGVRWAIDLGPDFYDLPGYFGDKRWNYYRLRTEGQNTLTVAGENQNLKAKAPLVAFLSTPQKAHAVADLTEAYQTKLTNARRGIALLNRRAVLVQDELTAASGAVDLIWNFHTDAAIETNGDCATLRQDGKQLSLRILSPQGARFEIAAADPRTRPGVESETIPSLDLTGRTLTEVKPINRKKLIIRLPQTSGARIAVLLAPDPNEPAPTLEPLDAWITRSRVAEAAKMNKGK